MAQVAAPRTSLGSTRKSALQEELDQALQNRRSRGLTTEMTTSEDSDSSADDGLGSDDDFLSQFTSTFKPSAPARNRDQADKWQPPSQRATGKSTPTFDLKGKHTPTKDLKERKDTEESGRKSTTSRDSPFEGKYLKKNLPRESGEHGKTSPSRVSPFPAERSLKSPGRATPHRDDREGRTSLRDSPFEGKRLSSKSPRDRESPLEERYRRKSPGRDSTVDSLTHRKSPSVEGLNRRKSPSRDFAVEEEHRRKDSPLSSPFQRKRELKNAGGDSTLGESRRLSERASPSQRARARKNSLDIDSDDMNEEEAPQKKETSLLDFLDEPSPRPRKERSGPRKGEEGVTRPRPKPRSRTVSENSQEGFHESPSSKTSLRRSPTKEQDRDLRPTPSPRGGAAADRRKLFRDSRGTAEDSDKRRSQKSEEQLSRSREASPSWKHQSGQKSPLPYREGSRRNTPLKKMASGSSEEELDQLLKRKDKHRQRSKDLDSDSDSIPDIDVTVKHKKQHGKKSAVLPTPPPRKSPFIPASQDKAKIEKEEKAKARDDSDSEEETGSLSQPDGTSSKQRLHKDIADAVLADVADSNRPQTKKDEEREDETEHTMQYIQPDSTRRRPQSAGSDRKEASPTIKPVPKRPTSAGSLTRKPAEPPNLEDSASIRMAIYQDWLCKKTDLSKEKIKKKLSERQQQQQKEKEEQDRKKDAESSYKSWKENKDIHLKTVQKQKKKEEKEKKEKEEEEQVKKLQAKKMFESWKANKDDYLRKKWRDAKREEEERKQKEKKEKQEDRKKLLESWSKRKEEEIKEKKTEERKKAREERRRKQKEQEDREMRCQDEYEEFLDRKERQRKEDMQRRRVRSMENLSQKAWSPASRTIPVGR
ncbi:PREDICTED: trichohyalin-like isoform X1 [Branchiostoma belcheri]|uniref:Trichohyalin-like isoform X1 n=1 Tax=Branchiostoma belcheri TaxID=7741 RepID=A0A6P4ZGB3_BRABE|nr:PREDICTED: trichohyalin-like isoform X1 [Branchiostoma belcheri]